MSILFVGLGGTGGAVLKQLKIRLANSPYKSKVAYLYIDSRDNAGEGFEPGEWIHIGGFEVSNIVPEHQTIINDWWYTLAPPDRTSYIPQYTTKEGAGQNRLIGRLCTYLEGDTIKERIETLLESSALLGDDLCIYVVASCGGGTGSALFTDIGYLLQYAIADKRKLSIIGCLMDGSVVEERISNTDFSAKNNSRINELGCLTELDYYLSQRSNDGKYLFNIHSKQGGVETIDKGISKPYHYVYLIQFDNLTGYHFDESNDYYQLMSYGLWTLAEIRFRKVGDNSTGTGHENQVHEIMGAGDVKGHPQKYGSFGYGCIVFPVEKVRSFCQIKYTKEILDVLLQEPSKEDIDAINAQLELIFTENWHIRESSNYDQLINSLRKSFYSHSSKWNSNDVELAHSFQKIINHLEINDINNKLESLKADLYRELESFKSKKIAGELDTLRSTIETKIKNEIKNYIESGCWKRAVKYLNELERLLNIEKNDIQANEGTLINISGRENTYLSNITVAVNDIISLEHPSLMKSVMSIFSNDKEASINSSKITISEEFRRYFQFRFLEMAVPNILDFYTQLVNLVNAQKDVLSNLLLDFTNYKESLNTEGILSTRADVAGNKKAKADFILEICSFEDVVMKMIYPQVISQHKQNDIKSLSRNATLDNLSHIIDASISEILNPITLDKALEYESTYFFSVRETNLKNVFLNGSIQDKNDISSSLIPIYPLESLNQVKRDIKSKSSVSTDETFINMLIQGRIQIMLDWVKPFWKWMQNKIDVITPHTFSFYQVNDININTLNILAKLNPVIAKVAESSQINLPDDHTILHFYQSQVVQPLFNLSYLEGLKPIEEKRRALFASPEIARKLDDPKKTGYSDRKFIFKEPYCQYSLYPLEDSQRISLAFALGEAFEFITTSKKGTRRNFQLAKDLGIKDGYPQPIGQGLDDAVVFFLNHPALIDRLDEITQKEINERKIKDKASLETLLSSWLAVYNNGNANTDINRSLYDSLRDKMIEMGLEIKAAPANISTPTPKAKKNAKTQVGK
jgi:hypothetical protein